jgi:hypothetical protein
MRDTMNGCTDIEYDFMTQTRNAKSDGLNIEDATSTWTDELTSYFPVAKITIRALQRPNAEAELSNVVS